MVFIRLAFSPGFEWVIILPRVISTFIHHPLDLFIGDGDRLNFVIPSTHCLSDYTGTGRIDRASSLTMLDSIFETFVKSVSEFPGIELGILRIAPSAWLMKRVAASTRAVPVTEFISDFYAICLDGPRLLDHTTITTDEAKGATMKVHWL